MSVDLTTTYLGLTLAHPVVASAGPLTSTLESAQRVARAGAAAVVLPSLFEEEVVGHELAEHPSPHPGCGRLRRGHHVPAGAARSRSRRAVRGPGAGRVDEPRRAGHRQPQRHDDRRVCTTPPRSSAPVRQRWSSTCTSWPPTRRHTASWVEARVLELVREVRAAVSIPIAVKLSPYFSALAGLATSIVREGADGLVLFKPLLPTRHRPGHV